MQLQHHWESVYQSKREQEVSWFEALPAVSLRMMESAGLTTESCVIDVGGGDSRLVDQLAARGLDCLAVIDVSGSALKRARSRLGDAASVPIWIEADVTADWSLKPMDIWHDRAVFHFLTSVEDRSRYRSRLLRTLNQGGSAIFATFALDGPDRCSGLPVQRYSATMLAEELGPELQILEFVPHVHTIEHDLVDAGASEKGAVNRPIVGVDLRRFVRPGEVLIANGLRPQHGPHRVPMRRRPVLPVRHLGRPQRRR